MKPSRMALLVGGLMVLSSLVGFVPEPGSRPVERAQPRYVLADIVPTTFGSWKELPQSAAMIVNPQAQQILDKIYSQILTRTYTHADGSRIMLSLAYGDDQRGGLQAHLPEVCYPAQGFVVAGQRLQPIATVFGTIPAQRLDTRRTTRLEPVTYWLNYGDVALDGSSRFERRLVDLRLALTGQVPDGLLVRVSSLDADPDSAFRLHDRFVADLLAALSVEQRRRFIGATDATSAR